MKCTCLCGYTMQKQKDDKNNIGTKRQTGEERQTERERDSDESDSRHLVTETAVTLLKALCGFERTEQIRLSDGLQGRTF